MNFKSGDRVRVKSINMTGTIEQIAPLSERAVVLLDRPYKRSSGKTSQFKLVWFKDMEILNPLKADQEFKDLWDKAAEEDENE